MKLRGCKLFSLKPLEGCDDGHIDVSLVTSVPKRKQIYDKVPRRHLLLFKPRTNQKYVHGPALLREVGIKNNSVKKNKKTEHG